MKYVRSRKYDVFITHMDRRPLYTPPEAFKVYSDVDNIGVSIALLVGLCRKCKFDLMVVRNPFREKIELLKKHVRTRIEWLPWFVDTSIFFKMDLPKKYDVVGVGTINVQRTIYRERARCFNMARRLFPNSMNLRNQKIKNLTRPFKTLHATNELYNSAKITLCIPGYRKGLPYLGAKYFEIPACNTVMLCKDAHGLDDVFEEDTHFIKFNNEGEFAEKATYLLKNDSKREEIQQRVHAHIAANHTCTIRTRQFMNLIRRYL